ncbi:MFS transporter (plasmid) [Kozakia baliensis]|uniref:MFS transporter n=1 Tax=Kozakia baliensis TaxID=153496 RepID=UPI00345C2B09
MNKTMRPAGRLPVTLISATIGNIVEWYDFALYTAATPLVFARLFFKQNSDAFTNQIETIALFAAGFLVRPIGGIIFGRIGDRYGHVIALQWTLLLIGIATSLIGLLPTYEHIGLLAPLLLLLLRLVQGVAAGGEWAGSILVIGDVQPCNTSRRTVTLALSQSGVAAGMVLGTGMIWLLGHLPEEAFLSWGWRVAFLLPLPLIGLGVFLRASLLPSPARNIEKSTDRHKILRVFRDRPLQIIRGIGIRVTENGGIYLISVFGLSYGRTQHVPDSLLLAGMTCGLIADGIAMPVFGWVATRIGHARTYRSGSIFLLLLILPFFRLIASGEPTYVIGAFVVTMMLAHAPMIAVEPFLLERLFPQHSRYLGVAVSHEFGAVLAGGLSPLFAALLYHHSGSVNGVVGYVFLLAVLSLLLLGHSDSHLSDRSSRH